MAKVGKRVRQQLGEGFGGTKGKAARKRHKKERQKLGEGKRTGKGKRTGRKDKNAGNRRREANYNKKKNIRIQVLRTTIELGGKRQTGKPKTPAT